MDFRNKIREEQLKDQFNIMHKVEGKEPIATPIEKSVFNEFEVDIEKGGKPAQIGESRVWNGKKVRKESNGKWVEVSSHGMSRKEHLEYASSVYNLKTMDEYNKQHRLAASVSNKEFSNDEVENEHEGSWDKFDEVRIYLSAGPQYSHGAGGFTVTDKSLRTIEDIKDYIKKNSDSKLLYDRVKVGVEGWVRGTKPVPLGNFMLRLKSDIEKSDMSAVGAVSAMADTQDNKDIEKGGKPAFIGEVREFAGKKYKKTEKGWRPVSKEEVKTPEEISNAHKELELNKIKDDIYSDGSGIYSHTDKVGSVRYSKPGESKHNFAERIAAESLLVNLINNYYKRVL